ncbi:MAG: hypothetical protein QXZ17_05640 [Nitrososphaerota archaeon]
MAWFRIYGDTFTVSGSSSTAKQLEVKESATGFIPGSWRPYRFMIYRSDSGSTDTFYVTVVNVNGMESILINKLSFPAGINAIQVEWNPQYAVPPTIEPGNTIKVYYTNTGLIAKDISFTIVVV